MPDNNENPPSTGEIIKTIAELLLKDEEFRRSLGRHTTYAILITIALIIVKLTVGIPFFSLDYAPLAGITSFFLLSSVANWLRRNRPSITFYLCPEEARFIPLKRTAPRIYRKLKACSHCGCALLKTCRQGKHPIVSPDQDNPEALPKAEDFCPFCDPALPKESRLYLPPPKSTAPAPQAVKS